MRGASFRVRLPTRTGGGGEHVTEPVHRLPLALRAAPPPPGGPACPAAAGQPQAPPLPRPSTAAAAGPSSPVPSSASPSVSAADQAASADSSTTLVVPDGEGAGALSAPRQLTVPSGWTARVWARVDDARMEAWTPEGDLLVSTPNSGSIMELRPDAAGTGTVTTLLSGLTVPQGMAFAQLDHRWVLYVAGSDQIDQYPRG